MTTKDWNITIGGGTGGLVEVSFTAGPSSNRAGRFTVKELSQFIDDLQHARALQLLKTEEDEKVREATRSIGGAYAEKRLALESARSKEPA